MIIFAEKWGFDRLAGLCWAGVGAVAVVCIRVSYEPQHGPCLQVADAAEALGDPVVVRRDGAVAYPLVALVDDHAIGVTRQVRGMDLLYAGLVQAALAQSLAQQAIVEKALPEARYHALLLEPPKEARMELRKAIQKAMPKAMQKDMPKVQKWSKFHGAVAVPTLRQHYGPEELCGFLSGLFGIGSGAPCRPEGIFTGFFLATAEKKRPAPALAGWCAGRRTRRMISG